MLTGESNPVAKAEGDKVVAGSVATDNSIRIEVTAIGDDTALGGIQRLVADAQNSKSRAQALADRAAAALFYVAIGAAVITAVVWLALGHTDDALIRTVTVLIIACPHALGLAIPLVISLSTAEAAQAGILVKDRLALETMRTIDTVIFDKTGTLTAGEHVVAALAAVDGNDGSATDRMLALAAGVEADSEHPLARAIVRRAEEGGIASAEATDFHSMTGRGVSATIDGQRVAIGGPSLLRELDLTPPAELRSKIEQWETRGAAQTPNSNRSNGLDRTESTEASAGPNGYRCHNTARQARTCGSLSTAFPTRDYFTGDLRSRVQRSHRADRRLGQLHHQGGPRRRAGIAARGGRCYAWVSRR
jgi:Cu2+-exporting ATPase